MSAVFIPNQTARQQLSLKLNLVFTELMQDWEYEVSDPERIQEFINEYDKSYTTDHEKRSLMEIILDSANILLHENRLDEFEGIKIEIIDRLERNQTLHRGTIAYWRSGNFEISDKLKH